MDVGEANGGELPLDVTVVFKLYPRTGAPEYSDGFAIARVIRADGTRIMLKGGYGPADAGKTVTVTRGQWQTDPNDDYFSVDGVSHADPASQAGICRAFERLGVEGKVAGKLAKQYGAEALRRLDDNPALIPDAEVAADWAAARASQRAMQLMAALGITSTTRSANFDFSAGRIDKLVTRRRPVLAGDQQTIAR